MFGLCIIFSLMYLDMLTLDLLQLLVLIEAVFPVLVELWEA